MLKRKNLACAVSAALITAVVQMPEAVGADYDGVVIDQSADNTSAIAFTDGSNNSVNSSSLTTRGVQSHGIYASGGSSVSIAGGSVAAHGDRSRALWVTGIGSRMIVDGADLSTHGKATTPTQPTPFGAAVATASNGAYIELHQAKILSSGQNGDGLNAEGGSRLLMSGGTIETTGAQAKGAAAYGSTAYSELHLRDVALTTRGAAARGAVSSGVAGNVLTLKDSVVATHGDGSHGLEASMGSSLQSIDTNVSTSGANAHGLLASNDGSVLEFVDGRVETAGSSSSGIYSQARAKVIVKRAEIDARATGVKITSGSEASLEDVSVSTSAGSAHGIEINGIGSTGMAVNVRATTSGTSSHGLIAIQGGILDARGARAITTGETAFGARADGAGSRLALSNADVATEGGGALGVLASNGGTIELKDGTIITKGHGADGLSAIGAGSVVTAAGLQIRASGSQGARSASAGIVAESAGQVRVATTDVLVDGAGANAARVVDGGELMIEASKLKAHSGASLLLDSGSVIASDGASIEGNGTLAEFASEAANSLSFDRNVVALGDIRFAVGAADANGSGALDRRSSLFLDNSSYWKGATDAIGDLSLANGSRWDVTGFSHVGTLDLVKSSVVFDHADGQYKTLTVDGDFHADGGLLEMNTALGADNSPTDLLHVKGDTTGNANIAVTNIGGVGAQTEDGIKLVQVDGLSAGHYALAGRAVGGAYEYFLYQGSHKSPNDGDWYLRSELSPVDPPVGPCNDEGCTIEPPVDPCGDNECTIDPPVRSVPVFRPEAGAYLANQASALGLFNMDLHERVGEPNLAQRQRGDGNLGGAWARVTTDQPRYRINEQLTGHGRQSVVQVGSDVTYWGEQNRGVLGIMVGGGNATNRVTSSLTGYSAEGRVDGRALGVYGTWLQGAEDDDGLYIDGWVQAARFKNRVQGDAMARENYRSRSLSASLEAGYALRLLQNETSAVYLEPQVQAIWTDYRMDGGQHQEVNGTIVKAHDVGGLQTRAGVRLYGHNSTDGGNRVQPFVGVNWIRNGSAANTVWVGNQRVRGIMPKNLFEAKAGAELQLSSKLTGWGEVNVQQGEYGFRSVGGQLGVKYAW